MHNDIPAFPNPAVRDLLLSPHLRALMVKRAEAAQTMYRSIVAKRTGRLAASARVDSFIGGRRNDRWVARLTVGDTVAYYAASHEYGADDGNTHVLAAAHDLNRVLNALGQL